jgi:hypothetical protein
MTWQAEPLTRAIPQEGIILLVELRKKDTNRALVRFRPNVGAPFCQEQENAPQSSLLTIEPAYSLDPPQHQSIGQCLVCAVK